jgi:hypothetical protein
MLVHKLCIGLLLASCAGCIGGPPPIATGGGGANPGTGGGSSDAGSSGGGGSTPDAGSGGGAGGGSGGAGTGGASGGGCPNLRNYWPADDKPADAVGNDDLVLQNGVTFALGKFGDAFSFNGSDSAVATRAPSLPVQGSWTYTLWINVYSYPNGDSTLFIDRTTNTLGLISLKATGSSFEFQVRYDDGSGLGGSVGGTIRTNNWTHLALVRDVSRRFHLYVDGQDVASTPDTGASLTPPVLKLGQHAYAANSGFTGLIDDLRIFDAALSGAQIQALANNQLCTVSGP